MSFALSAASQQGINYKAIINDNNGDPLANTAITVQFTILENGTIDVYQETHSPATDANGIIIVNIGEGSPILGNFSNIDWGSTQHFLKTEINTGTGLTDMGTTAFKTVPLAIQALIAEAALYDEVDDADADAANEIQTLSLTDYTLSISGGNNVVLPFGNSFNGQYYYADKDGDGYGNIYCPVYVPTGGNEPVNFVLDFGDCNDEDENIHPAAIEVVDGVDNNCDGVIDE